MAQRQKKQQASSSVSLFAAFDKDGDGKVSASELRGCMAAALGEENVSLEEAAAALAAADADGDGLLDPAEFARLGLLGAGAEEDDVLCRRRCLREAFAMYAGEKAAVITPASLGRMLGKVLPPSSRKKEEEVIAVEECVAMIRRFDLDGDGVLSFEEFAVMMTADG